MLRMQAVQVEQLWDEVLPVQVRVLPADLAVIDQLLDDPVMLAPIARFWQADAAARGTFGVDRGRPTIAMQTYVRIMIVRQRTGWGYETAMREVSDSLHLRRFCRIAIDVRVPDESTVRKLTRRLGPEVVAEISRAVIGKAVRETRFVARAVRVDSTVVEADVRYPTDSGLAGDAVKRLAREGTRAQTELADPGVGVRDRSRSIGRRLRKLGRAVKRRTGEAKDEVLKITGECGELAAASAREARRLAQRLRKAARGRGAQAKVRAAERLEHAAELGERIVEQIRKRLAGETITGRMVSLADPDARPIRKGKAGKSTEFGSVHQIAEVTPHTRKGARGFVLPPASGEGNLGENALLEQTVKELQDLGLTPKKFAFDGGFRPHATRDALAPLEPDIVFIAGRPHKRSRRSQRRLAGYRTGCEGRISHLKRGHGLRRSRLRGRPGREIHVGWAALSYNLQTYTHYQQT